MSDRHRMTTANDQHRAMPDMPVIRKTTTMPKKNGTPKHTSDLSSNTADLRGSLGLPADVIDGISQDMKAMLEGWKRQNPRRRLPEAKRQEIYETVAAQHGTTAELARLIAWRTNNKRENPKGYTLRASVEDRAIWGELAAIHGTSIVGVVHLAMICFAMRLGLTSLLGDISPVE